MRTITLLLISVLTLTLLAGRVVAQTNAPKKPVSDAYRNAQWKPEKGKVLF